MPYSNNSYTRNKVNVAYETESTPNLKRLDKNTRSTEQLLVKRNVKGGDLDIQPKRKPQEQTCKAVRMSRNSIQKPLMTE